MRVPRVTVVMPVFNTEAYVAEAVQSVLEQTWRDLELVVVDDGSTDRSVEEVERVADHRVRILAGPHAGVSAARNQAVASSDSEFVALMDSDDVSCPVRLHRQISIFQSSPIRRLSLVGCSCRTIDEEGRYLGTIRHPTNHRAAAAAAYSYAPVHGPSMMVLRDRLSAAGPFNPAYDSVEDYELVCRLLRLGDAITNTQDPVYGYRWHDASTSSRRREEQHALYAEVRRVHWDRCPPKVSLGDAFEASGVPRRLHASALLQVSVGLARRRRFAPGACDRGRNDGGESARHVRTPRLGWAQDDCTGPEESGDLITADDGAMATALEGRRKCFRVPRRRRLRDGAWATQTGALPLS